MEKDRVNVEGKKWEFNEDVAACFGDMLSRSIPGYEIMRELTFKIGRNFVKPGTAIMDIGCSDGRAIQPFISAFKKENTYKLFDVSKPMLEKAKKNFELLEKSGIVNICEYDVTKGLPETRSSVILSVLSLQFIPIEHRQKVVKDIYNNLIPGGAFILIEKVLGNTQEIDDVLVKEYYEIKKENQYTEKQIADKRKSLEGVLVPIAHKWNEDLLRSSGFKQIDCFYRFLNFSGWIAIK